MNLDFDKKKFTCKFDYCIGKVGDLADPSLHAKAAGLQAACQRRDAAACRRGRIHAPKGKGLFRLAKVRRRDGAARFFDGEKMISVNPGGTVRIGCRAYEEAENASEKSEGQIVRPRRRDLREGRCDKRASGSAGRRHSPLPAVKGRDGTLGLAVFDLIELDGKRSSPQLPRFSSCSKNGSAKARTSTPSSTKKPTRSTQCSSSLPTGSSAKEPRASSSGTIRPAGTRSRRGTISTSRSSVIPRAPTTARECSTICSSP